MMLDRLLRQYNHRPEYITRSFERLDNGARLVSKDAAFLADLRQSYDREIARARAQFTTVDEYGGGYAENIRYSGDTR